MTRRKDCVTGQYFFFGRAFIAWNAALLMWQLPMQ